MAILETKLRKHVPNQRKDLKEAIKLMRGGNLDKAEKLLTDILDGSPDLAFAHMLLGNIHYKNKNYMGALEEYQQALELNPELAQVPLMMGRTYSAMEDADSAIEQFDHALQLDPSQVNVYLQKGRAQMGADHFDEARETLEKALNFNPLLGFSYDVNRSLSIDGGATLFKQPSISPLQNRTDVRVGPVIGVNLDIDGFNRFSKLLGGEEYRIDPNPIPESN